MVLYFTGTGNSRYLARRIAEGLEMPLYDLNAYIKAGDTAPVQTGRDVVLVTPTYAWRIPRVVSEWLGKTALTGAERIWFVMDCGSEIGNAAGYNRQLAAQKQLQCNPKAKTISYWKNTSDNAIIRSFIDYAGSTITNKLETLMAGGCIVQRVDENLTYDYLHSSEDNLWSTLYLTGYLTKAREDDYKGELPDGMVALMIPNAEIKNKNSQRIVWMQIT